MTSRRFLVNNKSGAGGRVLRRDQSHTAEDCPSGRNATSALPDNQLFLYSDYTPLTPEEWVQCDQKRQGLIYKTEYKK